MPTHPISKRYPVGTTHRITVTTVRETPCVFDADSPEQLFRYWTEVIATQPDHEPDKESMVVVMLTTRLRPFSWHRVSLGTVNETSAHPREVLRPVIVSGAYGFALMHNHPSGESSPSRADETVTRRMIDAAALMQIRFLDHVIVGEPAPGRSSYFSFREAGIIS
jgi:DNA repair protein RadC